ncbi:DMT family transporter [Lutimaribacter marinistellae]|uniref:DMT family transporter n=1 Tax=Lutimaribacter marinistellae TaxID=1820329 RepID=A0ABV7TMY0_9RHOB
MSEKRPVDAAGAVALIGVAALLAFNQVVIKVTGGGFGPIFQAGLRSTLGAAFLLVWMRAFRIPMSLPAPARTGALLVGLFFSVEFMMLFIALDLTSVSRVSILFYSMPVWLALAGHMLLPGERLTGRRMVGLVLAMAGVALAFSDRQSGAPSLVGDLLSIAGAMCWAGIALTVRVTPLSETRPETQLLSQLAISAPVLLVASVFFGEYFREPTALHWGGLFFQSIAIVCLAFLLWFRLLATYQANGVASFSFLSPVLAVLFGWILLGEQIGPAIWGALGLVAAGIYLINRR